MVFHESTNMNLIKNNFFKKCFRLFKADFRRNCNRGIFFQGQTNIDLLNHIFSGTNGSGLTCQEIKILEKVFQRQRIKKGDF